MTTENETLMAMIETTNETTNELPWYCSEVGSVYGAPHGRHSYGRIEDQPVGSLWLAELPLANGDPEYDAGGAYWGHIPGNPVWCLFNEENEFCRYDRAINRERAIKTFGVAIEQLSLVPQPRYVRTPDLFLDIKPGDLYVCVTALIEAFENEDDYDRLMLSAQDYCLPGGDSHYSWRYAKETVADWRFGDNLYAQLKDHYKESGCDITEWTEWGNSDFRAMLLQEVACEYVNWRRHGEGFDSISEWLKQEGSSNRLSAGDDDEYYMYIDI